MRTALVTGASKGIGRAIAIALAEDGFAVACGYGADDTGAKETASTIEEAGGTAAPFGAELGDEAAIKELFAAVAEWREPPLVLVNNAGTNRDGLTVRFKTEEFDRIVAVNLTAAFVCAREALPAMMKQRWGRIVNVSSVVALRGNAGQAAYAASKTGLLGLTRTLAKEYASRGITTNAVCPGYIGTEMTAALPEKAREKLVAEIPAGRIGEPEEVAAAVRFLASDAASYVNGSVLAIDGGMTA